MIRGVLDTGSGTIDLERLRKRHPPSSDDTLQPSQAFAGFTILAILGRGGMGEVYLAREDFTDRVVALKVLPIRREASQDAQDRMRREAAAGVRLDHPNIVRVYGGGLVDGKVFISMEWLQEGKTLREIMIEGPVAVGSAVAWAAQVADALDAMHRINVWHRDLKPENAIVVPGGRLKLIDFGLARVRTENLKTTKPANMGTPHYMAPEQGDATFGANDGRVDIYALGLILGEMLCGHHMFEDSTRRLAKNEVYMRHLAMEAPKLSVLRPSLPRALSDLVERMLQKRPVNRPSAHEVALELVAVGQELQRQKALAPPSSQIPPSSIPLSDTAPQVAPPTFGPPPVPPGAQPAAPSPHGPRGTVMLDRGGPKPAPATLVAGAPTPPRTMIMESLPSGVLAAFQPELGAAMDGVARSQQALGPPRLAPTVTDLTAEHGQRGEPARTFSTDERFGATSNSQPSDTRSVQDAALSGAMYGVAIVGALLGLFILYVRVIAPPPVANPSAAATQTAAEASPEPAPTLSATAASAPPLEAAAPPASASASSSASTSPPAVAAQPAVTARPAQAPRPPAPTATATAAPAKTIDKDKPYF
jgi:serine/threonine-protein kinase